MSEIIESYISKSDWRVNENSNVNYSFSGLLLHAAGTVVAKHTLSLYPVRVAKAHQDGRIHLHDLSMGIAGYCAGWSLKQLLQEGFNGVSGKIESSPPKHFSTALLQMINFLGTLQNEWAGAMAFSSVDTYLAPFVRSDNISYEQIKQHIQQFVYNLNVSSRWGGQTPFTNITLDWTVPEDMKTQKIIIGGMEHDSTYGEYQKEMDLINKAFIEVMIEGDMQGRVFTFPIPTYNITKDFAWDSENAILLFEMTAKYGIPYFQNFVNSSLKPSDVRSMCCRLQMDLRELRNKTGGLFGAGESTGSIGVVTLNLARAGYEANDEKEFIAIIDDLLDIAFEALEFKRKMISENLERGLFPYTKRYLGGYQNHFSTIGINGMNEALLNLLNVDIATVSGKAFALKTMDHIRERLREIQERSDHLYNLEATPAEGTAYRFARIDKQTYPDIITQGGSEPYYTNSTHLPVGHTTDVFEALEHQDALQTKYTGGTVLHCFVGERISDPLVCRELVKRIAYRFKLPYFTITPTFSICSEGYIAGEVHNSPTTGKPCDVYSRVVGYFRPVSHWNNGKKAEFSDRKTYVVSTPSQQAIQHFGPKPSRCLLFTTPTCPNCKVAKDIVVAQKKVPIEFICVSDSLSMQFARKHNIEKVPTAVFLAENEVVAKITGNDQIKQYMGEL